MRSRRLTGAFLRSALVTAGAALVLAGCATIPNDALVLSPDSLQLRQLQSRRIDGISEQKLLEASAGVLQDLGFNIDESETRLGVIVASKDRSAFSAAQLTTVIAFALLGVQYPMDKTQKIRVSLVTRPVRASDGAVMPDSQVLRITIQRLVWDVNDRLTRVESVEEPDVYQAFFNKLSKSVFLELQAI